MAQPKGANELHPFPSQPSYLEKIYSIKIVSVSACFRFDLCVITGDLEGFGHFNSSAGSQMLSI